MRMGVPIAPLSDRDMAAQSAMLTLLRAGAPSSEILLAKDLDALVSLGARLGIPITAPVRAEFASHASTSDDADADEISSYNVRRFTAPPSAYAQDGALSSEALSRARARRQKLQPYVNLDPPTGGASPLPASSFTGSPSRRAADSVPAGAAVMSAV